MWFHMNFDTYFSLYRFFIYSFLIYSISMQTVVIHNSKIVITWTMNQTLYVFQHSGCPSKDIDLAVD